jgi:hypothetical protein
MNASPGTANCLKDIACGLMEAVVCFPRELAELAATFVKGPVRFGGDVLCAIEKRPSSSIHALESIGRSVVRCNATQVRVIPTNPATCLTPPYSQSYSTGAGFDQTCTTYSGNSPDGPGECGCDACQKWVLMTWPDGLGVPFVSAFARNPLGDTTDGAWRVCFRTKYIWAIGVAKLDSVLQHVDRLTPSAESSESSGSVPAYSYAGYWSKGYYALHRDEDVQSDRSWSCNNVGEITERSWKWREKMGIQGWRSRSSIECDVSVTFNHINRSIAFRINRITNLDTHETLLNIDLGVQHFDLENYHNLYPVVRLFDGSATILS